MLKKTITISSLAILAACGGGSSSSLKTGTIDKLAGVEFRTETQSGNLNSSGEYQYKKGESVTFFLGDMEIGALDAAGDSSLVELLGLNKLPTTALEVRSLLRMPEYTRERIEVNHVLSQTKGQFNSLHRVSNLMRLLIALDNDNDSSNGFDVTGNAAALTDLNLDLDVSLYEFSQNTAGLAFQHDTGVSLAMDVARPLRDAYELANISLTVPERIKRDGSKDFTYTALGQIASTSQAQSSDTLTEYEYTYSGENGEMLTELYTVEPTTGESDYQSNRRLNTMTYNDFGLLKTSKSERFVEGNTSVLDYYNEDVNTYMDDKVYLVTERNTNYVDANGTVSGSTSIRKTYDADKKLTSNSTFTGDTLAQETFNYGTKTYNYDSEGRVIFSSYENLNSNTTSSYDYSYSENEGNKVSTRTYNKSNGTKTLLTETVTASGVMASKKTEIRDSENVATSIYTHFYTYDDQGRLSGCRKEQDSNANGDLDLIATSAFTYANAGLEKIEVGYDSDADGSTDSGYTSRVVYGDNGELVSDNDDQTYTYGNAAQNGISYLIYEYQNPVLGGDAYLFFYPSSVKCVLSLYEMGS